MAADLEARDENWAPFVMDALREVMSTGQCRDTRSHRAVLHWGLATADGGWLYLTEKGQRALCAGLSAPEPDPVPTDEPAVWDLVIADMRERDREGRRKYGTPLQASNGRDHLVDAYQESLDLCVYLRAAIERRRMS